MIFKLAAIIISLSLDVFAGIPGNACSWFHSNTCYHPTTGIKGCFEINTCLAKENYAFYNRSVLCANTERTSSQQFLIKDAALLNKKSAAVLTMLAT